MKEVSKLNKFYITTAIPYVNAPPHVGHALEFLQTDTVARFQRSLGKDVFFLTGTDENAQKNVLAAEEKGIGVQELVDRNTEFFRKTIDNLGISYDDFIRTTDKKRHWTASQKLWNECLKSGDIYKKTYEGLYCVGCEAFLTEKDLVDGKCPEHLKPPEKIKEENYFFKLSKYQKKLEKLIESDQLKIIPETRKNEILSFIRSGLEDFSVSRPKERMKGWGIPVPNDENQMIYVWFDALINYLSGLGYGSENELFKKYWPADLHVIGKGIIRFHAVYWPAMLLSAGLPLPKSIFVHGYITTEGKKISKSLGNVIDPNDVVKKYGLDSFRYFMLREISPFDDGDFSEKALVERVNNELVANIGNFVYRTLSFMDRYFDGIVPAAKLTKEDKDLIKKIEAYSRIVKELLGKLELKEALQKILELSAHGNKYFQENKPWVLIKENRERCGTVIYTCTHLCRALSILLFPYLPGSCVRLWHQLNLSGRKEGNIWDSACSLSIEPGHKINKPEILFKKIDVNDIEEVEKNTEVKDMIPFKYFKKMEFRVGTVKEAEAVEESDKLIKMRVDFGDFQRQVVAGLTPYYKPEDLSGKQWVFITNLEHAKLMGIESEAMILAAVEGEHEKVVCLKPDKAVKNGTPIS